MPVIPFAIFDCVGITWALSRHPWHYLYFVDELLVLAYFHALCLTRVSGL